MVFYICCCCGIISPNGLCLWFRFLAEEKGEEEE